MPSSLQLTGASDDLGTLAEIIANNCPVPSELADDLELVERMWAVGEAAREYALAMIARIAIENQHRKSTKRIGKCPACGTIYDDIDRNPPPKRCWGSMGGQCGLIFETIPLKIKVISRYASFEELENELIERGVASHGTIYNRIQSYRRMVCGLQMPWEESYRAVRASPSYVMATLELARWNNHGEMVDVPESVQLPNIADAKGCERIKLATAEIASTLRAGTGVIEDNDSTRIKSEQIQQVKLMRGKPVVQAYQSNPLGRTVSIPVIISSSRQDLITTIEDVYELRLFRNGEHVPKLEKDVLDAMYEELNIRIPNRLQRKELWER